MLNTKDEILNYQSIFQKILKIYCPHDDFACLCFKDKYVYFSNQHVIMRTTIFDNLTTTQMILYSLKSTDSNECIIHTNNHPIYTSLFIQNIDNLCTQTRSNRIVLPLQFSRSVFDNLPSKYINMHTLFNCRFDIDKIVFLINFIYQNQIIYETQFTLHPLLLIKNIIQSANYFQANTFYLYYILQTFNCNYIFIEFDNPCNIRICNNTKTIIWILTETSIYS